MDSTAKNKAPGPLRRSSRQTKRVIGVEPTPRGPLKRTRKASEPQSSSAVKGGNSLENGLDDEESPTKIQRLETGEGEHPDDDNMEVQESVKETESNEDLEMDTVEDPINETCQPKMYKEHFGGVNFSPRVVLRKPSILSEHPYEESKAIKSKKAEIKAPPSPAKAHSPITPPEKIPAVPVTSMQEYKRKMEYIGRSAGITAPTSQDVHRANHILRGPYPTLEKIYPTRALGNNIPAPRKADYLEKQDAKKKSAGAKLPSESSRRGFVWCLWHFVLLVLVSSATLVAYKILPVLLSKARGEGQQPRDVMPEMFSDRFSLLQSQFPSQQPELWRRTKIHLENHLNTANPAGPVSLILAAGLKAEKTVQCLAQGLASTYSSARYGAVLLIDGATRAGQDSDGVKLDIDNQLQAAFEGGKPAAIIHRFEELPPASTIIFYRYCDHETAAYKQVFLLFTVLLPQDEISSDLNLKEVEEEVHGYLELKLVNSTSKPSFDEMDIDKFSGLWSRISHLVLPVVPELNLQDCQL